MDLRLSQQQQQQQPTAGLSLGGLPLTTGQDSQHFTTDLMPANQIDPAAAAAAAAVAAAEAAVRTFAKLTGPAR